MAGGMEVHKNRYVEDWGTARENLEKTFRFNRRTLPLAIIFGIAVPYVTYRGIVADFVSLVSSLPPSLPKPPFPHFCCLLHWSQLLHHRRSLCLAASSVIASWCVWVEQMLEASESMHQVLAHHVSKCKSSLVVMEEAGTENSWKIWCLESLSPYSFHQEKRSRWSWRSLVGKEDYASSLHLRCGHCYLGFTLLL